MTAKNVHIIKNKESWAVKTENSDRVFSTHNTQKSAVEAGREIARAKQSVLVVHGTDGRVSRRDHYLVDPTPPKSPRKVLSPAVVNKKNVPSIKKAVGSAIKNSQKSKS